MTAFTLGGLALGTEYLFGIMAFNNLGESNFTQDIVKARTSSESFVLLFCCFFFPYSSPPLCFHFFSGPIFYYIILIVFWGREVFLLLLVAILNVGNRKNHPAVVLFATVRSVVHSPSFVMFLSLIGQWSTNSTRTLYITASG